MPRGTLVFLPGMMCDARLFGPQRAALSRDRDIIVGDLAGRDTIAGLADKLLSELPDRFALAGLSMGGIVAMAMAGMAPERIERLALLDTNHLTDIPERRTLRDAQLERVRKGELEAVVVEELKPNYLAERNRGKRDLLDLLRAMALDLGEEAFVTQTLALRDRPEQTRALSRWHGPALVLCGAEDRLCPPERHREIAALLHDAELEIVPGAGHITTLEAPDRVTSALTRWLARSTKPQKGAA